MKQNHWLYGEDTRKYQIDEETNCNICIHEEICWNLHKQNKMEILCKNFKFGTSEHEGCLGCEHHFTRYDNIKIPCFICKYFKSRRNKK